MDEDLGFKTHVNKICKTVSSKVGWLFRSFDSRDVSFLKQSWKTLIQPHIDYCSILWFSPEKCNEIKRIENLQRHFTERMKGCENLNYWQRLEHLKMLSQQRRLERYRIIYVWKILEGLVPNCGLEEIFSERRGRLVKIRPINKTSTCRAKTLRDGSFQINGPQLFNSLPAFIRNMSGCGLDDFKSSLDKLLEFIPDEPKCETLTPRGINIITARPSNSLMDQIRYMDLDNHDYYII